VTVSSGTVSADTVLPLLLHDQYEGLTVLDDQSARRERLAEVAKATVQRVEDADADLSTLADELRNAGRNRHLLAWAVDPALDAGWQAAGIGGELQDASVLVAVANRGGNKLDQYLEVSGEITAAEVEEGGLDVTMTLTLRNEAPLDDPPYILGAEPFLPPGTYPGFVTVVLPRFATDVTIAGADELATQGPEGGVSQVVASSVLVDPGGSRVVTITFRLPDGAPGLRIEPSARVPGIAWTAGDMTWTDVDGSRTVELSG
jgi:hypothetical protein